MQLFRAGIEDLDVIVPLFDAYRVFYQQSSNQEAARKFLLDRLEKNESVIYFARTDETGIGFTQLYPLFSSVKMRRVWVLNDLFVAESHRGTGVASALMKAAQDFASETSAAWVQLETAVDNDPAKALYRKLGYTESEGFLSFALPL